MKKLTFLFGALLIASLTLTSCGSSMESDAKKAAAFTCQATDLMGKVMKGDEDAKKDAEKLQEEMKPFLEEMEEKYKTKEEKAEFKKAVEEEAKDCK